MGLIGVGRLVACRVNRFQAAQLSLVNIRDEAASVRPAAVTYSRHGRRFVEPHGEITRAGIYELRLAEGIGYRADSFPEA